MLAMLAVVLGLSLNQTADYLAFNGQRTTSTQGAVSTITAQAFDAYREAVFNLESQDPSCTGSWSFASPPIAATCPSDGQTYPTGLGEGSLLSPYWENYQNASQNVTYAWYANPNIGGTSNSLWGPGTIGEYLLQASKGSVLVGISNGSYVTVVNTNIGGEGGNSNLTFPIAGVTIPAGAIVSFEQAG